MIQSGHKDSKYLYLYRTRGARDGAKRRLELYPTYVLISPIATPLLLLIMTAFPLTLLAVAMAVISWMPSINHAFSSPAVLTFPSSSPLQTDADDRKLRWPPTMVLRSVPSARSAADEVEEFKADGRSLLDDNIQSGDEASENIRKSFLQRIFKRGGVRALPVIRGDKYGASNNSTILAPSDAAIKVGVEPTLEATKETWQRAWRLHRFMMRILHRFDKCQPKDSKLALCVISQVGFVKFLHMQQRNHVIYQTAFNYSPMKNILTISFHLSPSLSLSLIF